LLFYFELTSNSDLTWTRLSDAPPPFWGDSADAWQQGLIDGGTRFLDKKKQEFTFGTLFYGLELLGAAWENGTHIFSIEQLNQRKTTRPKAQSIYQRIGEAPWGCIRKSWPNIVVLTQLPEPTLMHEWMDRLMPADATTCRPDRVLVISTVEDYMTFGHKVWEKQLFARGYDPTYLFVYKEDCGSPTQCARVATLCIMRDSSASSVSLPFSLLAAERLPPRSASFALMDYKIPARAYIKKVIKGGRNHLLPNYVGHIGPKPVYEANRPLESMEEILVRKKEV
jgi:hypothetical protein